MNRTFRFAALFVLAFAVVGLSACQPQAQTPAAAPAAPDYAAELGPKLDAVIGVWNSQDYAQLDGLLTEGFIRRAPDQNADGREAMKAFMQQVHTTYPDFHIVVDERAFAKDLAFLIWTVTGTYTVEGAEPAAVDVTGATLLRFSNGMVTEEDVYYDTAGLMAQTGAASVPHAAQE